MLSKPTVSKLLPSKVNGVQVSAAKVKGAEAKGVKVNGVKSQHRQIECCKKSTVSKLVVAKTIENGGKDNAAEGDGCQSQR